MEISLIIVILLTVFGLIENYFHQTALRKIPVRVHINGSRGKSSVTRLIAGGLRSGNIKTLAKTTGTAACIIYPDGSEVPIRRRGPADIIEQLYVFREAADQKVRAIVIECMAIRPDLQKICEEKLVQSTLGVVTNVRADHLDVMGPGLEDIMNAFSKTLPSKGSKCFTAETNKEILSAFEENAGMKGVQIVKTQFDSVTDAMMEEFDYLEHKENVAIALAVCQDLGVSQKQALTGMYQATPDPGALRIHYFQTENKNIEFINAFSANDPDSIINIWMRLSKHFQKDQTKIVLLNTRKKRLQRSMQLAELVAKHIPCNYLFLVGDDQKIVKRCFLGHLMRACEVIEGGEKEVKNVCEDLMKVSKDKTVIFGIGNVGGVGQEYVDYFVQKEQQSKGAKSG